MQTHTDLKFRFDCKKLTPEGRGMKGHVTPRGRKNERTQDLFRLALEVEQSNRPDKRRSVRRMLLAMLLVPFEA